MGVSPVSFPMHRTAVILASIALLSGCVTAKRQLTATVKPTSNPATRPTDLADLSLEEIHPTPEMPPPATQPTTPRAPLEAIELFAHARDAMLQGQRYTAINLLEKAIRLDPGSFELHYWLGQANAGSSMPYDPAIAAYESAAAIEPDHI